MAFGTEGGRLCEHEAELDWEPVQSVDNPSRKMSACPCRWGRVRRRNRHLIPHDERRGRPIRLESLHS